MHGRLGHQILGQLLVAGTSEPAVAGAAVVIAATSRQKNAVAQVALRTAAPALAVHGMLRAQVRRIERREAALIKREQAIIEGQEGLQSRRMSLDSNVRRQLRAVARARKQAARKRKTRKRA
jgi:hypothetical protein